jgi:hypothetical protein
MNTPRTFSKLLINEPPLQVLPSLAVKVGLNGAIFLQQVHYWISQPRAQERDGRFWVYNSLPQWREQFPFWSEDTIQRTIAGLEQRGVLLSGNYNERGFDKTKWYTIDYEALDALEVTPPPPQARRTSREIASRSPQLAATITAECGDDNRKLRRPIPETNTETNNIESMDAPDEDALFNVPRVTAVSNTTVTAYPPGTNIKLRRDLPPVRPMPKPSEDPAVMELYTTLKGLPFPTRDGKIHSPGKALAAIAALPLPQRARLLTGARHYATAYQAGITDDRPKDLHNWITDLDYDEWQEPAQARPVKPMVRRDQPPPRP